MEKLLSRRVKGATGVLVVARHLRHGTDPVILLSRLGGQRHEWLLSPNPKREELEMLLLEPNLREVYDSPVYL